MDFNYINEFLVLTESPNLSEAALRLNVSESSLSRHIKSLEDELGCPLFERTSRSFKINHFGLTFLPYARDLVALYQRCCTVMQEANVRDKSSVTIVSNYYIGNYLAGFFKKQPSIATNLVDSPNDLESIKNQLRNHECTFAFVIDFADTSNEFISFPFLNDHYILVVPAEHPLASENIVSAGSIEKENFISFRKNSYGDIQLKKICHAAGFAPHINLTSENGISICQLVSQGLGISILHNKSLYRMGVNLSGIRVVEMIPERHFTVSLVYRKGTKLSLAEQTFLEYFKQNRDLLRKDKTFS